MTLPSPLSFLLAMMMASPSPTPTHRKFQFVDYGQSFSSPDGKPTISCDGRIPGGVTLELTHWTGNDTPDELYADTSTEMALKLAQHEQYAADLADATVLNNHYDTDGVLSVWACLEPAMALKYSDLLIRGAEAGDFGEWSSDLGVKLDCALCEMCTGDDEASAFQAALNELPQMLQDFEATGGKSYEALWKPGFDYALKSWDALQSGDASLTEYNDDIAILREPSFSVAPYALHRGLKDMGSHRKVKRILKAISSSDKASSFKYEKTGHGWIQKVVERPTIPNVDSTKLVEKLNSLEEEPCWKSGGGGLISICYTTKTIARSPEQVAETMAQYDDGLQ